MRTTTMANKIKKLGGTFKITGDKIVGELNKYDIEMDDNAGYFTARRITDRNHFDAGSDYNPGGYMFLRKLYQLEELI